MDFLLRWLPMQEDQGPRPFDATARMLIEMAPEAWLACVGLPVNGPVRPIDSNVSTVLAEVDKMLHVGGPVPWLAHLELQSSHDPELPLRMLQYNVLLLRRHRVPVVSTVVLLRPEADGREMSGQYIQEAPVGDVRIAFQFRVVRIWQQPAEDLLTGALGTLPLAPLAAYERGRLPELIDRIGDRLTSETSAAAARDLWAATFILMGLRYDADEARQLLHEARAMRESATYQWILDEGRVEGRAEGRAEEARRLLIRLGSRRYGPPSAENVRQIEALDSPERLEQLADGLFTAGSWNELLAGGAGE